ALKERVDVQVFNALAPEESAGHRERLALQFQEVKQDQEGRDEEEQGGAPPRDREVIGQLNRLLELLIDLAGPAKQVHGKEPEPRQREQEQRDQRQAEPGSLQSTDHRTSPRWRRYGSTRVSNGTRLLVNRQQTPRRVQNSYS